VLEGTECTAAWCSVDNWQPLTCCVYFNGELKGSNDERRVVLVEEVNLCVNFTSTTYLRLLAMGHTLTKRSASQHHLFTAPRSEKKDQFILSIEIICPTISNIALTLSLHAIVECLVQRKLSNTVGSWSICQVSLNSSGGKAVSESYHRIWSHCLRL